MPQKKVEVDVVHLADNQQEVWHHPNVRALIDQEARRLKSLIRTKKWPSDLPPAGDFAILLDANCACLCLWRVRVHWLGTPTIVCMGGWAPQGVLPMS